VKLRAEDPVSVSEELAPLPVKTMLDAAPSELKPTTKEPPAVKLVKPESVWLTAETVNVSVGVAPLSAMLEATLSVTGIVEAPVMVPLMFVNEVML
jgi:hypothetical protein